MRSRNRCCHGNATVRSILIVIVIDVAVNTIKVFSVAVAMEMHRCRSAKYFVLLLAIISIKHYECVSVFLPQLPGMQITPLLRRVMLPTLVCLALSYFPTLSQTGRFWFGA